MNMCLLEVAMCEKCRSSDFQSEGGGVERLRTGLGGGEGVRIFRTGGPGYFCWGRGGEVSTPLHAIKHCLSIN